MHRGKHFSTHHKLGLSGKVTNIPVKNISLKSLRMEKQRLGIWAGVFLVLELKSQTAQSNRTS